MRNPTNETDVPTNPSRRGLFRNLAKVGDPNAPYRAPWSRVPDIGTVEGDVLWAGWASANEIFVIGDEGRILHFDGAADACNLGSQSRR